MNLIETNQLTVHFGGVAVLQGISFEVNQGEYLAVVGPNGSGKTTLIRSLLGLVKPSSGSVNLLGQPLNAFNQWQRIGYLPQVSRSLHAGFPATVREVISTGLLAEKRFPRRLGSSDQKRVDDILEILQIRDLGKRMIGELSGGQQQRVLLGRALVSSPELLILDEPTVALDPETRARFYNNIQRLNKESGTTIILITHDSGSVGEYASKLLYLDRRIVFFGNFEEFCHSHEMSEYFGGQQHMICHRH